MKRLVYILFLIPFLIASCGKNENSIEGKISNLNSGTVVLEKLTLEGLIKVDSSKIDSYGNFSIPLKLTGTEFYRLVFNDDHIVNLILDSTNNVTITGDWNNLTSDYKVTGSKQSEDLALFNHQQVKYVMQLDSVINRYNVFRDSSGLQDDNNPIIQQIRSTADNINEKRILHAKNFIDNHLTSLASIAAIEILNKNKDNEYYIRLQEKLVPIYPNNSFVKAFNDRTEKLKVLGVGSFAPNITLPNPDGKVISLESFKGKYVLIDFWASWCAPCRAESPKLVAIYKKYKNKNFEILGVSLDAKKEAWVDAIKTDKLIWSQISDLGYWQSSVVKQYNLEGIPFSVLINPEGKIVSKGFSAIELDKILSEIL